jgi:hypothetical protein
MTNPPTDLHGFWCCTTLTDSTFNLCRFGNTLEVPQGAGSGFMWDTEGHVVTNFHVRMWGAHLSLASDIYSSQHIVAT